MGIRVMAIKAIYIVVLRADINTGIIPLVAADTLYRFRLDLDYSGLYHYT